MRPFLHVCLNRTPVIGLLMAALLFRALIPAGFMPTRADDGTIVMELCSGFTTKSVHVHLHEADSGSDSGHRDLFDHSPCGFAVATPAATPPASFSFPVPVWLHAPFAGIASAPFITPSIHRSQTPRGPPSL